MRVLILSALLLASLPARASGDVGKTGGIGSADAFFGRSAAPAGPSGGESFAVPDPPPSAPPVPLDGGLGLLAVAGAGYAARRLRARRA